MTRARLEADGAIHHVVVQGVRRDRIVRTDRDRASYLQRSLDTALDRGWVIHAGCLLDTHDHRIIETPNGDLGAGMKRVLGGYARWYNERHGLEGAVFARGFWSRRIRSDLQFLRTSLYVDLNAFMAGLCRHPLEWGWGTYAATQGLEPELLLPPMGTRLVRSLGATPLEGAVRYRELVQTAVEANAARRPRSGTEAWARVCTVTSSAVGSGLIALGDEDGSEAEGRTVWSGAQSVGERTPGAQTWD